MEFFGRIEDKKLFAYRFFMLVLVILIFIGVAAIVAYGWMKIVPMVDFSSNLTTPTTTATA
jgi:hypothetical protein